MADQSTTEPDVGRGVDPGKVIAKLTQQAGGLTQELAIAHVLVDDLREALAAEREASAGLRAELVAASSSEPVASKRRAAEG